MYAGGLKDEKLNLLYSANKLVKIAVRTPVGKSDTKDIHKVVIQGDVFGPLLCSKQVDLFAQLWWMMSYVFLNVVLKLQW